MDVLGAVHKVTFPNTFDVIRRCVGGRFPRARPQPQERQARPEGCSARAVPAGVAANFTSKCRDFGLVGQLLLYLFALYFILKIVLIAKISFLLFLDKLTCFYGK